MNLNINGAAPPPHPHACATPRVNPCAPRVRRATRDATLVVGRGVWVNQSINNQSRGSLAGFI